MIAEPARREAIAFRSINVHGREMLLSEHFAHLLAPELVSSLLDKDFSSTAEFSESRGACSRVVVDQGTPFIARKYRRGGWLRFVQRYNFLRLPWHSLERTRPFAELRALSLLQTARVQVPQPVAALVESKLGVFYRGMILTEEIREATNLLTYAREMERGSSSTEILTQLCYRTGIEAKKMLSAGVMHRDLHLGNVLFSRNLQVTLIDFDKCGYVNRAELERAKAALVRRWTKSARKHGFQTLVVAPFYAGLSEHTV